MNRPTVWGVFGPVVVAFCLLGSLFALPLHPKYSERTIQRAAVSLSPNLLKNRALKHQALKDSHHRYVPFLGSSEFNRMDAFHPAVMAARYHSWRPFFFGAKGAQSLSQLFNLTMMGDDVRGKQVVFVLSPQWFTKEGVNPAAFRYYNGTYANLTWLAQADPKSPYDRYVAKRLVKLTNDQGLAANLADKVASGRHLSSFDRLLINGQTTLLTHEDELFAPFLLKDNYGRRIAPKVKQLPKHYDYQTLIKLATSDHADQSTNNRFGIKNAFFRRRVKHKLAHLKGSQAKFNYLRSPEYADLEAVLAEMAKNKVRPIFVIPPINQRWAAYTGLSMPMYHRTAAKLKHQLTSQGFTAVVDLSKRGTNPACTEDTIHIGWAGWVAMDRAINPLLEKGQPRPHYHLNPYFLSKRWQNAR